MLLTFYHAPDHLLVTSSWDFCLRFYDTRGPPAAIVVPNENHVPFTGIWYDAAAQQVRCSALRSAACSRSRKPCALQWLHDIGSGHGAARAAPGVHAAAVSTIVPQCCKPCCARFQPCV